MASKKTPKATQKTPADLISEAEQLLHDSERTNNRDEALTYLAKAKRALTR